MKKKRSDITVGEYGYLLFGLLVGVVFGKLAFGFVRSLLENPGGWFIIFLIATLKTMRIKSS
jgi:hypothetical protein